MKRMTFHAGRNRSDNLLHIETDGCIVNIQVGFTDNGGRQVTRVDVLPDDDTRGGDGSGRYWYRDGARVIRLHEGETRAQAHGVIMPDIPHNRPHVETCLVCLLPLPPEHVEARAHPKMHDICAPEVTRPESGAALWARQSRDRLTWLLERGLSECNEDTLRAQLGIILAEQERALAVLADPDADERGDHE